MTSDRHYTIGDLERARTDLERWNDRWANDSSNNPAKFNSQRTAAHLRVQEITAALKAQGDLPTTEHERLCTVLDGIAPNARHGDIVLHNGSRFRRVFYPQAANRSGQIVTDWSKTWEFVA